MNFKEALSIVVDEAEVSAIGESTDEHAEVLKACEVVQEFINHLPSNFTYDKNPKADFKSVKYTDFCNDEEKMKDFNILSKEEFLKSYSYLHEVEYNLTRIKESNQSEKSS
jgi:hypothetical protein